MPKLILKCPFTKGGTASAAAHLENLVNYAATRDGVDKISDSNRLHPATQRQQAAIEKLLKAFPESRHSLEYEDYTAVPTRGSASEFISQAVEENLDQIAKLENYVDYIAMRPHAERQGAHGLFSATDAPIILSQTAKAVAEHPGNVWKPIISLRREDAAGLGYDSGAAWRDLLRSLAPQMAEAIKIKYENFRWYAAYHDEAHHPHVHMLCYSADPKEGYLTVQGIEKMKSQLAGRIFRQEQLCVYEKQTTYRDRLTQDSRELFEQLCGELSNGECRNPKIAELAETLSNRLQHTSGKKVYGYLKPDVKALVDEIVDELARDPRAEEAYRLWYEMREEVLRVYSDQVPPRLPLSQQKEFKRIKNIVIEEVLRMNELPDQIPKKTARAEEPDMVEPSPREEPTESFSEPDAMMDLPALTDLDCEEPMDSVPDSEPQLQEDVPDTLDILDPHIEWSDNYREAKTYLYGGEEVPQDFEKAFRLFMEEALEGNALAMHDLGRMYADGLGREIDLEQAQAWYSKALETFLLVEEEKPNRYPEYRIGKMYAAGLGTGKSDSEAAEWFAMSSKQSYKYAQYSLAGLYMRGNGVELDQAKAFELYEKAAGQGFPYAQFEAAKMLRDGIGTEVNESKSAEYFIAAYKSFCSLEEHSHDDRLQYRIGWMLLNGVGTEKDEAAAKSYFEKAAKLGNVHAQYQLAKLILSDANESSEKAAEAIGWLTKAAEEGNHDTAQYALAKLYRDGGPVEKNIDKALVLFSKAAEQKNAFAQYALGKLYLQGEEVPKDIDTAIRWLTASAKQGNQFAQYALGKLHLQGEDIPKDIDTALRWLTVSADQENQFAQYALGKLYLQGEDIPKDIDAALRWLAVSAEQGNQFAQYALGKLYLQGEDMPKDIDTAIRWLTASAEQGNQFAQYALGKLYLKGEDAPKDVNTMLRWLTASAEQGNQFAQYALGKLYLKGEDIPKDVDTAIRWLAVSAEQGNQFAQYALGKLYLSGENAPKDVDTAVRWLTASAEQGNQFAQYVLGKLYLQGDDISKDVDAAVHWLTASAEQENQFAQYALGKLYLKGEDVSKDVDTAVRWLTASAEQGNQFAQYALGKLYLSGENAPKDVDTAIRWLAASAEQGNQFAQYALGKLYLLGKDVPRDKEAAMKWFTLSAAQGNEYAQYFLDHMDDVRTLPPAAIASRLLHHLGNIFYEQKPLPPHMQAESKLRRKIKEKKEALGHAKDEQEPHYNI